MGGFLATFFMQWPWLFGAMTAGVPLVLHLIYRRRAPRVVFPTLRFIRASAERTARRRRIQEWLLLLLRMAALFFLAVGLAGPVLRSAKLGKGGGAAIALVMDNSYSMATNFEGTSRYARGRDYAIEIFRTLGKQEPSVMLESWPRADARAKKVLTSGSSDVPNQILVSDVSIVPGDLTATVAEADEILKTAGTDQKEIYVLTDLQRSGLRPLPKPKQGKGTPIILVDCGPGEQRNVAITEVTVKATRPAVGAPVEIKTRIRNYGNVAEEVGLVLYVGGEKRGERAAQVEPNSTAEVSFAHTFERAGTHAGWVDLEVDDSLGADNRRYFCLDVPERVRVGIVREREGVLPLMDEAYFMVRALNPAPLSAGTSAGSSIEPVTMLRSDLAGKRLSDYAVLFLLNLPELSEAELKALSAYLRTGGAVVIFPGDLVNAEAWNAASDSVFKTDRGLLPGRLLKVLDGEQGDEPVTLEHVDTEHPIFAVFKRLPGALFSSVNMRRYFDIEVPHGSPGRVLARLSNGKPFLVEKTVGVGRGKVLLFCTSATSRWSNLPSRTLYLPLLHQVTYYLVRSAVGSAATYYAGNQVRFPPGSEAAPKIEVKNPLGTVVQAKTTEGAPDAYFTGTSYAGIYEWTQAGKGGRSGSFVVNSHPEESDLSRMTHEAIEREIFEGRKVYFVKNAKEAADAALLLREGISLQNSILCIVVGLLIAECFLANRTRKAGTQAPVPTISSPAAAS